jgi:hypothetical protein
MSHREKEWLSAFDWNVIVATNHQLCLIGNALHRPTSDDYKAHEHFGSRLTANCSHSPKPPTFAVGATDSLRSATSMAIRLSPSFAKSSARFHSRQTRSPRYVASPGTSSPVIATAEEQRAFAETMIKLSTDEN